MWNPIETVPVGMPVLLTGFVRNDPMQGRWYVVAQRQDDGGTGFFDPWADHGGHPGYESYDYATHWMHLLPSPEACSGIASAPVSLTP